MMIIDELIKDEKMVTVEVDWVAFDKRMLEIKRTTVMAEQNAVAKACRTFLNA